MILILILSNLGLAFGLHYCGEELIESKIMISSSHELGCGMETLDCEDSSGLQFDNKDCCNSIFKTIQSDNLSTFINVGISLNTELIFPISQDFVYLDSNHDSKEVLHSPPQFSTFSKNGFQILYQTFLI